MKTASESKATAVEAMFSSIAKWYDFLNHFLSLGLDITWRRKAIACFTEGLEKKHLLDLACGTADLSIEIARQGDDTTRVTGADFSSEMLRIGEEKIRKGDLGSRITLERADALNLSYEDSQFDGITCAFGVRNFAELETGLKEMIRVIKPGSRLVILEFTTPSNRFFAATYKLYFTKILPMLGGLVSGNREAYSYLPDSVYKFPVPSKLSAMLCELGLEHVEFTPLTFGICGIHTGVKR